MSAKNNPRTCPVCATRIPEGFPEGLCPKCLLAGAKPLIGGSAGSNEDFVQEDTMPMDNASPGARSKFSSIPSLDELRPLFPEIEILDVLGVGGMGAVYKARQPRLDRFVALKIMVPTPGMEDAFAFRFEREAQVLARLQHPNIVILHNFGEIEPGSTREKPLYWFLMEYVDGIDLGKLIHSRELKLTQVLSIVAQICDALQYAHDQGITHRDIKPANILIDKKSSVKIADFGLAKMLNGQDSALAAGLTLTGTAMGTPHYMAPEIWDHPDQVDHRADIYALGVVLYEMLTGERPVGVFEPPSRKASGVSRKLDNVVSHAMEKDPARRYQQAVEVKDDVRKISGSTTADKSLVQENQDRRRTQKYRPWIILLCSAALLGGSLPFLKNASPTSNGNPNNSDAMTVVAGDLAVTNKSNHSPRGSLKAQGVLRRNLPIDLTKAEGITDFVQVFLLDYGWIALRSNGQTVSSDGRGERSNISKICTGFGNCFALIDTTGRVELINRGNARTDPNSKLPGDVNSIGCVDVVFAEHQGIALLKDGSARVWGDHYDNPQIIPDWLDKEPWDHPPAEALLQVVSIAITPMSSSTVTADGRLWTWGKRSVTIPNNANSLQGEFTAVISSSSGLYDARTKDGRVVCFNLSMRDAKISAPESEEGVFGSYRPLHRKADGRWFTYWSTPTLQPFLDAIRGLPSTRFSLMTFHEGGSNVSTGLIYIHDFND